MSPPPAPPGPSNRRRRRVGRAVALAILAGLGIGWLLENGRATAPESPGAGPGGRPTLLDRADQRRLAETLLGPALLHREGLGFQGADDPTPRSFAAPDPAYWADFVCGEDACAVHDVVRHEPFSLLGADSTSVGAQRQVERVLASTGANIYDAAVWQIAVALAGRDGLVERERSVEAIRAQQDRLHRIVARADVESTAQGQPSSSDPSQRFAHRFLGPSFFVRDPLAGRPDELVSSELACDDPRWGAISWPDWKPITGENAWAHLIGPLQARLILADGDAAAIPADDRSLTAAIAFLQPLAALQDATGGLRYAVDQSLGNDGTPVPAGTISVENNLSIVAGLRLLAEMLDVQLETAEGSEAVRFRYARTLVDDLLFGTDEHHGALQFLREHGLASSRDWIVQGGISTGDDFAPVDEAAASAFAVDVNTWGVAVLGPATIDRWWGAGTAHRIWETTRRRGGYRDRPGELLGVGYSSQPDAAGDAVLSGEWTFGALLMVRSLLEYYGAMDPTMRLELGVDLDRLAADERSMARGVLDLRSDRYHEADGGGTWRQFPGAVPPTIDLGLRESDLAFLYSSRRVFIPFGWYANPLPSTASSAWALLLSADFNPFGDRGEYGSPTWEPLADDGLSGRGEAPTPTVTVRNDTDRPLVIVGGRSPDAVMRLAPRSFEVIVMLAPVEIVGPDGSRICTAGPREMVSATNLVSVSAQLDCRFG